MNPAGPKAYKAADMLYGLEEIEGLREQLILIRNAELEMTNFQVAVVLSHTIALLAAIIEDAK